MEAVCKHVCGCLWMCFCCCFYPLPLLSLSAVSIGLRAGALLYLLLVMQRLSHLIGNYRMTVSGACSRFRSLNNKMLPCKIIFYRDNLPLPALINPEQEGEQGHFPTEKNYFFFICCLL